MKKQPPKYDTSSALKKLREAGVSRRQAEAHVEVISDALENVTTKADLEQMENSLIAKIDQGYKLLSQQMDFMKEEFSQQMEFQRTDNNKQVTSLKEGFNQQVNALKEGFNQQIEFLRNDFNQKMETNFYKLLVLLPAAVVSLYALYDYLKDKLS